MLARPKGHHAWEIWLENTGGWKGQSIPTLEGDNSYHTTWAGGTQTVKICVWKFLQEKEVIYPFGKRRSRNRELFEHIKTL